MWYIDQSKLAEQIVVGNKSEMEEDDFEYDITFPTKRGLSLNEAASPIDNLDDFAYEDDSSEPEPVVYLLGWAGCKDKYLAKYSEFYEQKGCISIRYTAPTAVSYFDPPEVRVIAKKLLDLIPDYSLEENPVFFHVFSNNGCSVYAQMSDILCSGEYKNMKVKGCIIDSAPGKRRILQGSYAFAMASGKGGLSFHATFLYILAYLMFTGLKSMLYTLFYGQDNTGSPHTLYGRIKNDKSRWPQLFFFSKGDKIIPYTDSEEVLKYRSEVLKVQVDSQCYDESGHCSHLRNYRENYISNCYQFIDKYKNNQM